MRVMGVRENDRVIGVDVGGTKIAAAAIDADGQISWRVRRPTPVGSPAETLEAIAAAVEEVMDAGELRPAHIHSVGLGIPGLVDPATGVAIASVNLEWRNVPVKATLEQRLGMPCTIENDVNAAALGEIGYGVARGLQNVIYLVIGTGIAAGIVIEGRLYRGSHGMAGEIGHAVIRPDGPRCKCGARGCLEALVAGPGLAERAVRLWEANDDGRSSADAPVHSAVQASVAGEDVFAAAKEGDSRATLLLSRAGEDLAFAMQFLLLAYDPQMIVLGGGVMESSDMVLPAMMRALERQAQESWIFASIFDPQRIKPSQIQADIGILGAAALARQQSSP